MVLKTRPYDVVRYLRDPADMAAYLEAALEDGHPAVVTGAIGDVARALGMTDIARRTGLGRESLYKSLSVNGNPEFATVMKVIRALGFRLTVKAIGTARVARAWSVASRKTAPKRNGSGRRKGSSRARATA